MKQVWVKRRDLRLHRLDDARGGVADVDDGDSGAEVDQRVAVDVDDHAPAGTLDEDREGSAHATGDDGGASGHQFPRTGARDLGDQLSFLREA